jgi:hypothetical protein
MKTPVPQNTPPFQLPTKKATGAKFVDLGVVHVSFNPDIARDASRRRLKVVYGFATPMA